MLERSLFEKCVDVPDRAFRILRQLLELDEMQSVAVTALQRIFDAVVGQSYWLIVAGPDLAATLDRLPLEIILWFLPDLARGRLPSPEFLETRQYVAQVTYRHEHFSGPVQH